MYIYLTAKTWRVLRAALRSPHPLTGRALRFDMSRATKDGSFLTELIHLGLLKVVTPDPDPFAATYAITPAGERAAEYGEYDYDHRTRTAAPPAAAPEKPAAKKGKGKK